MGVRRPVAPAKYRSSLEESNGQMGMEGQGKPLRAVVAAVQLTGVSDIEFNSSVTELRELAKTLEIGRAHV